MGAERGIHSFEIIAWRIVFALGLDTLMIVDVVLPAVLGLVCVGKPRVERCSLQFYLLLHGLRHLFS